MQFIYHLYEFCQKNDEFMQMNIKMKMSVFLAAFFSIAETNEIAYDSVEQILIESLKKYPNAPKEDYGDN